MSWARLETTILTHPKWQLPDAAFKFGIRLLLWANLHSRGTGVVPQNVLDELAGSRRRARRLVKVLEVAGRPIHDVGLVEPDADGAVRIHDFQNYLPPSERTSARPPATTEARTSVFPEGEQTTVRVVSPEVSAARAEAGRRSAEVRREKQGTAAPVGATVPNKTGVSHEQTGASAPNKTGGPQEQNLNKTGVSHEQNLHQIRISGSGSDQREDLRAAAAKDLTGHAREAAAAAATPHQKVSCPKDLSLTDAQQAELRAAGVPDWAAAQLTARFRLKAAAHEPRTLGAWQNSLLTAVHSNWHDPKLRPIDPTSFEKPGVTKVNTPLTRSVRADGTVCFI